MPSVTSLWAFVSGHRSLIFISFVFVEVEYDKFQGSFVEMNYAEGNVSHVCYGVAIHIAYRQSLYYEAVYETRSRIVRIIAGYYEEFNDAVSRVARNYASPDLARRIVTRAINFFSD